MTFVEEPGEALTNSSVDSVEIGGMGVSNTASDGGPKRRAVFDEGGCVGERTEVRG